MQTRIYKEIRGITILTIVTISESKLITSRLLNNKAHRLDIELNGTIKDLLDKSQRVSEFTNDMYMMLSEIEVDKSIDVVA